MGTQYQASADFFDDEETTAVDFWANVESTREFARWYRTVAILDAGTVNALAALELV